MLNKFASFAATLFIILFPLAIDAEAGEPCKMRFMETTNDVTLGKLIDDISNPDFCPPDREILLTVQSDGGAVDPMLFAYKELRAQGNINTIVQHNAASSAILMFLAGNKRTMSADATLLIHEIKQYIDAAGLTEDDIREMYEGIQRINRDYATILAARTGLSLEDVKKLMRSRTTITAPEAVALGFATDIAAHTQ